MASVLIVDDEIAIASLIEMVLKAEGHACKTALSGAEAEALAEQTRPDLVIVDVMLPDMDGVRLARNLRERMPDLRVILSSGMSGVRDTAPEFEVLEKPFHVAGLARIVARTLSG